MNAILTEELVWVVGNIPKKRVAKPSDVAGAVNYLVSFDADYITGITIFVDGGRMT